MSKVHFIDDDIVYPNTKQILQVAKNLNLKTTYISFNLDEDDAKSPFIKNWVERPIDYEERPMYNKNVAIITGHKSGLVCIDIDNKVDDNGVNGLFAFESMIKTNTVYNTLDEYILSIKDYTLVEKTPSGGFHIYFQYDETKHRHLLPQFKHHSTIDVKGNGGCCIMSGSVYLSCCKKGGIHKCGATETCKYKYKKYEFVGDYSNGYKIPQHYIDNDPIEYENRTHWGLALPMPDWIYKECQIETKPFSYTTNDYNEYDEVCMTDEELLDWVLPLNDRSSGHFWDWFSIVVAIKKCQGTIDVAKQYSMLCPEKYDEKDLEKRWNTIDFNNYEVCPNFKTIKWALKKQDFEEYKRIDNKYNKKYKPIYNDKYGAKLLVNLAGKDNFVKLVNKIDGSSIIYVFEEERGQWLQNNEKNLALRALINKYEMQMRQYEIYEDAKGNEKQKLHDYSGVETKVNALCKFVPDLIPTIDEMQFRKMNLDTKEKLLFKNGILDMKTGEFKTAFDKTLFFLHRINRNYNPRVDEALKNKINKICFHDAFDYQVDGKDYRDSGDYFRKGLSFGLAGRTDAKMCFMNIGETNCGKSILTLALQTAMDEYFGTFDANNFIVQKNEDEAKALKWLYDCIGKRVLISNEMKKGGEGVRIQFDTELLKKVVGGGDTLKIRKLGKNEIEVVNQAMFVFMLNDIPDFNNPEDDAFKGRNTILEYKLQFVPKTEEEIKAEGLVGVKPKDITIAENFIKNDEWKDALLHLILDEYRNNHFQDLKTIIPETVKEAGNEWLEKDKDNTTSMKDLLEEAGFEITNHQDDFTPIRVIYDKIFTNIGGMTIKMLGKKIKKLTVCSQPGQKMINNKLSKGIFGLKYNREY